VIARKLCAGLSAGAASLTLCIVTATAATPSLPECTAHGVPVTLTILTNAQSGWKVNGQNAVAVSNVAWANASPATWIGRNGVRVRDQTFQVRFLSPGHHGAMSVTAQWAADNCGEWLRAGSGPQQSTGMCYNGNVSPDGSDFMYFNHTTTANFAPSDSNQTALHIRFRVGNQPDTPAGFAGIFTITAQCP
jgi:hypothetical protein